MEKCPICKQKYTSLPALITHISKSHDDMVPESVTIKQYIFNIRNRYPANKTHGSSVILRKPTKWNEETGRYERFSSEAEAKQYREEFRNRMMKKYGKEHLLDDPNHQIEMLKNRKISGSYKFQSGKTVTYTGTYELDFCKVMDTVFNWDASDIIMPSCQIIEYINPRDDKIHSYIPDVWIPSLNLVVEIKSEKNEHYRLRDIDIEKAKDAAMAKSKYNYVKVMDKDYNNLINEIKIIRDSLLLKV